MAGREVMNRTVDGHGGVSTSRRWAEYLVAVLAGNIAYLFLEPELPTVMRHRMFRIDVGLAIDFLICVGIYVLVRFVRTAFSESES
jgi:hypothetical protein